MKSAASKAQGHFHRRITPVKRSAADDPTRILSLTVLAETTMDAAALGL